MKPWNSPLFQPNLSAPHQVVSSDPAKGGNQTVTDLVLIATGVSTLLIVLIFWFDNPQGGLTGNGAFKSLELKPWIEDPANAPLYPSNYLFYPLYGWLCRALDILGVFVGDPRRQMTVLNAVSASLCLCSVYLLVRTLTGDRLVSLLAALFHIASSFVMILSIINEDIMPSYTLMFAAMAVGAVWFPQPTAMRVIVVSALFSLSWLMEWRLMFPTLPAMLTALWLCENQLKRRLIWIALFLTTMFAMACVVAWIWRGHNGFVGPLQLIWTGKGVGSAWGGFSWAKVDYMWDGVAGYLLGVGVTEIPGIPGWTIWRYVSMGWIFAIAIVALPTLWRTRYHNRTRALAAIFGGTFVAGEVMNLYSQPQDPQMQINVMGWLTVGWALLLVSARRRWSRKGLAALAGLSMSLFAYNVWSIAPQRGLDGKWLQAIDRLEREADPARTVFLIHDFDWVKVYCSLHWDSQVSGTGALGPSPQAHPKFKWIGFVRQILQHHEWSTDQQVDELRSEIDRALGMGYDVLVARLWSIDLQQLLAQTETISDSTKLTALLRMLRTDYIASLAFDDPIAGPFHRLRIAPSR